MPLFLFFAGVFATGELATEVAAVGTAPLAEVTVGTGILFFDLFLRVLHDFSIAERSGRCNRKPDPSFPPDLLFPCKASRP